jgi:phospholipid/cholesterol/gamma-HCH transport system ATP-binding protein
MSLIQRLNHSLGLTSIIVSHHVHETLPICDQVIAIANGGIVFRHARALQSSRTRCCGSSCTASPMARSRSMPRRAARLPDAVRPSHPLAGPRRPVLADRAARFAADP